MSGRSRKFPGAKQCSARTQRPCFEIIVPVTAAALHAQAKKVQADMIFLLLPRALEACKLAAERGALGAVLRMDKLLDEVRDGDGQRPKVCPVEVGRAIVRELGQLGFASQVMTLEDERSWERLCLEVSWKEVAA